jgi:phospholipid/cholesterol/gamma-HCH transport system substrate-binding protein
MKIPDLNLNRQIRIQLAIFTVIAVVAMLWVAFGYLKIQNSYFGIGRYTVHMELPTTGDLYVGGNVTYRGYEVGRIKDIRLTKTGAEADLQLNSATKIPADLKADVRSVSVLGEQFVQLTPISGNGPTLKDGDVIPPDRTSVPPNTNTLLAAANRGLNAIPRDNLKTVVDESYNAVGGLGPELSRLIDGGANLSIDLRKNLDSLTTLIDNSKPLLDSQTQSASSVQAWAANLADITTQLKNNDSSVQGLLQNGPRALDEGRQLLDRLQPTLPIVLANLVSVGKVAVTYRDNIEGLLVLVPMGAQIIQAILLPNYGNPNPYAGGFLSFNLNLNLPPPCATGFYPIQQMRNISFVDTPDRPKGLVFCRIPQDSQIDPRGLRNTPCVGKPGKRAPTAEMCESDKVYEPLNDGNNWKGDPNATLTGQGVPYFDRGEGPPPGAPPAGAPQGGAPAAPPAGQPPPPPAAPTPAIPIAEYDPATGTYVGPDGQLHKQADLAPDGDKEKTWQQLLIPPAGS